jgi:hypothetical protein
MDFILMLFWDNTLYIAAQKMVSTGSSRLIRNEEKTRLLVVMCASAFPN